MDLSVSSKNMLTKKTKKHQTTIIILFLTVGTVQTSTETLHNLATSLADLSCGVSEEVYVLNGVSVLTCVTACTNTAACKSVAFDSGWCRGCSDWHANSTGLETRPGTKLYNKATGIANLDEDCSINPCLKANQICEFDFDDLMLKCKCQLGSVIDQGGNTCEKVYALNLESCSTLSCYGDINVECTIGTNICECTGGAIYFPEIGQCLVADVPYQQSCKTNACMEPNQICSDDDELCICDHGYKYNSSITKCVTECTTYGTTFQKYDQWKILWHDIAAHLFTDDSACETLCKDNSACRSFTIVDLIISKSCYLHDITAVNALPFWEYQYDFIITNRHYVRNCA